MLDESIEFHRKNIQREIARMQVDLDAYEKKYELSSASFYEAFEAGDLDDEKDYMLWAGMYEMQLSSQEKLKNLS